MGSRALSKRKVKLLQKVKSYGKVVKALHCTGHATRAMASPVVSSTKTNLHTMLHSSEAALSRACVIFYAMKMAISFLIYYFQNIETKQVTYFEMKHQ